jgi:hypothetical protein
VTVRVITDAVIEFLTVGRSVAAGSCDASGLPHATRCAAVRIEADRKHATLFLAQRLAESTLRHVAENPRLAIQISHPLDHRTVQLKGRVTATGEAAAEDRAYIERYVSELAAVVDQIGMPYDRVVRMAHWPAAAITLCVSEVFLQTPGPGAGTPLGERKP